MNVQYCARCDSPTGRCEDDSMYDIAGNPVCDDCYIPSSTELNPDHLSHTAISRDAAFDFIEAGIRLTVAAVIQRDNLRYDGEWSCDHLGWLEQQLEELDRRREAAREAK